MINAKIKAAAIPAWIFGNITEKKACKGDDPKLIAASSILKSKFLKLADTTLTVYGKSIAVCPKYKPKMIGTCATKIKNHCTKKWILQWLLNQNDLICNDLC